MKTPINNFLRMRCSASMTVEASYVIPMAIGVLFFCIGMLFFAYDRGVIYQNMLRLGIVMQMEPDEEKMEHEIELFPTLRLQSDQIVVERGQTEIQVSSLAVQSNPLKNAAFMPIHRTFQNSSQQSLPIFDPVEHLRDIRRAVWFAEKAKQALE